MQYNKLHPYYYAIPIYLAASNISYSVIAKCLGVTVSEFIEKIIGLKDFTNEEAIALSTFLNKTQDEIFLT